MVLVSFIDLIEIKKIVGLKLDITKFFIYPALSSAAAALLINLLSKRLYIAYGDILGLLISMALLVAAYVSMVVLTGCVSMEDLRALAKIKKEK